jgi:hypothetical protein
MVVARRRARFYLGMYLLCFVEDGAKTVTRDLLQDSQGSMAGGLG